MFKGDSYNEVDLQKAFSGAQLAFVNTNGFAIGEKAEIYWGIRNMALNISPGVGLTMALNLVVSRRNIVVVT
jgi:hypothetical protein